MNIIIINSGLDWLLLWWLKLLRGTDSCRRRLQRDANLPSLTLWATLYEVRLTRDYLAVVTAISRLVFQNFTSFIIILLVLAWSFISIIGFVAWGMDLKIRIWAIRGTLELTPTWFILTVELQSLSPPFFTRFFLFMLLRILRCIRKILLILLAENILWRSVALFDCVCLLRVNDRLVVRVF